MIALANGFSAHVFQFLPPKVGIRFAIPLGDRLIFEKRRK